MKRILCLLFCVITVISSCSLTIFAAEGSEKSVMEDLSTLYIDGKQFNEADYPLDTSNTNMYILTVVEKGFRNISSSPDFALYIYVYNPSGIYFIDREDNSVQIGVNADCSEYSFYRLKGESMSEDRRFIRFRVYSYGTSNIANLYKNQKQSNERVYKIACLRLYVDAGLKRYTTVKCARFKGFDFNGTLELSQFEDFSALDVEIYPTNWISPNAKLLTDGSSATIYDHYEINSVYFTIPEEYFADGYYLTVIRAAFNRLRLTPIVVSNKWSFNDSDEAKQTKLMIEEGNRLSDWTGDFLDLFVPYYAGSGSWQYSESDIFFFTSQEKRDYLAYYFESDLIPEDYDFDYGVNSVIAVSSEDLETYFYNRYNDPNYDSSKLYESKESFVLDYSAGEMLEMHTWTENLSSFQVWWQKLMYKNDSYLFEDFDADGCEEFSVIGDSGDHNLDYYINLSEDDYANAANELYIGRNDMKQFKAVCQNAKANGERVVILRYGFSDYCCRPLLDAWESNLGDPYENWPQIGFVIDKYAYMAVSLCHLEFENGHKKVVVPVVSNVADSFGDLVVFEDPNDTNPLPDSMEDGSWWGKFLAMLKELLEKLIRVLKVAGIVALVVVVVFIGVWLWLKIRGLHLTKKLQDKDKERLKNKKE